MLYGRDATFTHAPAPTNTFLPIYNVYPMLVSSLFVDSSPSASESGGDTPETLMLKILTIPKPSVNVVTPMLTILETPTLITLKLKTLETPMLKTLKIKILKTPKALHIFGSLLDQSMDKYPYKLKVKSKMLKIEVKVKSKTMHIKEKYKIKTSSVDGIFQQMMTEDFSPG